MALMLVALLASSASASPDISVDIVSSYTFAPDVNDKLKAISANLITNELSSEISGAYRVMAVCFATPVYGDKYSCELYVTVLSATDWSAVTYRLECDLDVASETYSLKGDIEPNVPMPSVPFDDSEGTYGTYRKGLADTPAGDIQSAVSATREINQYFKDALGSSTLLIGKKAKRRAVMNQLKYNRKLIAWNNIGHGSSSGLVMYDGTITSSDFCDMNAWRGLKDCVCFVNSCDACLDPLKSCILGGNGTTPDHEVRTYISGLTSLPIGPSDDTSREFWQHTLLECYWMYAALEEAANNHNLSGYYCLEGDTGTFFSPLDIKTIVSPGSCVVRQGRTMRITAKSDRYVFPGATVVLNIYNDSSGKLEYTKTWHITKKTKLLFKNHKWRASVDPGTYRIDIYVYSKGGWYCGEDHKWFAVAPKNGKIDIGYVCEDSIHDTIGTATGWVKPTKYRTFKVESGGTLGKETPVKPPANHSMYPKALTQVYQKTVPPEEKTWGEGVVYIEWNGMLTGIYNIMIEYKDNNGRTRRDRYSGKCALNYTSRHEPYEPSPLDYTWFMWGGSGSHWLSLGHYAYVDTFGDIIDWTRAKWWGSIEV